MSQMQPPRARQSKHRPETIQLLRSAIVNLGTLAVTALLLRSAIMLAVPDTTQRGLHLVARGTYLIVWPLDQVPMLQDTVSGGLTIADIVTIVVIIVGWFVLLGIIAGWEREGRRIGASSSDTGLRP